MVVLFLVSLRNFHIVLHILRYLLTSIYFKTGFMDSFKTVFYHNAALCNSRNMILKYKEFVVASVIAEYITSSSFPSNYAS